MLIVLIGMLCVGGLLGGKLLLYSNQSPSNVVLKYYDDASSGRIDDALALWVERAAPWEKPGGGTSGGMDPLEGLARGIGELGIRYKLDREIVWKDQAVVSVQTTFKNGNVDYEYYVLRKIDNRWLIDRLGFESDAKELKEKMK